MPAALILTAAWSLYASRPKMDAPFVRTSSHERRAAATAPRRAPEFVLELEIDPRAPRWNGHWTQSIPPQAIVRPPGFALAGPTLDAVRLLDVTGRPIEILWGARDDGRTSIEPRAPIPPGPLTLQVSYSGTWAIADSGLVRTADTSRVVWRHATGRAVPVPEPPVRAASGRLIVHVPDRWRVLSKLEVVRVERQPGWSTTVLRLGGSGGIETLEFEVAPKSTR